MADLGSVSSCAQAPAHQQIKTLSLTNEVLTAVLAATDFIVVLTTILLTDYFYHHFVMGFTSMSRDAVTVSILIATLLVTFQYLADGYNIKNYINIRSSIRRTIGHWILIFFIIAWIGFLLKITAEFSRVALTASFIVGALGLTANRVAIAAALERGIARGALALRSAYMICLGEPEQYGSVLRDTAANGVRVVGSMIVRPEALDDGQFRDARAAIVKDVRAAFDRLAFNEIYVFFPWGRWRALREIQGALAPIPLPVFLFADTDVRQVVTARSIAVGPLRGFEIQRAPLSPMEQLAKRGLDILVASAALLLSSPLMLATGVGILLESGRPILFRQGRKGFGDRTFTILKFRTMHCMEDGDHIVQATRNDSRVTRFGAFLRRASIDELPQLINVLRGEMSIVGPRPHALAHDNQYDKLIASYAFRRHVKPGLTGWAQVHGLRGETSQLGQMEGRVSHDLWYINNWSLWLDLWIMFKTLRALVFTRNAY